MSGKKIIDGLSRAIEDAKRYPTAHAIAVKHRWCVACEHGSEQSEFARILCRLCEAPEKPHFRAIVVDVSDPWSTP